jgi:hypothetical protein
MNPSTVHRVGFGLVAIYLVGGIINPVSAQKHTTVPPLRSWTTSDGTIWAENRDSVPVAITKMRISNCVNVQIPCRDSTPDLRILAPKEVALVAVIPSQDPRRPNSYSFGLDWRVATECGKVTERVWTDKMTGAMAPPELIEIRQPPGPYADKWPGSFPVRFFVAADGTVDSTVLINFQNQPLRETMQEMFSQYIFRPARFRGCPVPSSTYLRISTENNLPKPSAYEGIPPTPEEAARYRRGPPSSNSPPEPYIVRPACPFECCQYGEWQARTLTPVYATEGKVGQPLFTLRAGDSVRAMTGNVHVSRVGRVKILTKVGRGWAEFGEHKMPSLAAGDTVYVLSYAGEGYWQYWFRGLVGVGPELWSEPMNAGAPPGELLAEPVREWWVQVTDGRGRTGWLIVPPQGFGGYDACG